MNEKILWILLGMIILILIRCLFNAILLYIETREHFDEIHHCNYCRKSFVHGEEKQYKYCPYCGRLLTFHYFDERLELDEVKEHYLEYLSKISEDEDELDEIEIGLERVNNIVDEFEDNDIAVIIKQKNDEKKG